MELLKKYWWLIPLAFLIGYIAYVILSAKSAMAEKMERVREAKLEKSLNSDVHAGASENLN